jgi:hypothetical protein
MSPQALIERARAEGVKLKVRDGTRLVADPIDRLSPELWALLRAHKPEVIAALADPAVEARRQRVLAMLAERPEIERAVIADDSDLSGPIIVAIAIKGIGTCELTIPRNNWKPLLFLDLISRTGSTVH